MRIRPEVEGQIEEPIEISGTGWDFEITADIGSKSLARSLEIVKELVWGGRG